MENVIIHATAKTEFIEVNGISYAYRTFSSGSEIPLVFLQHFTGNMDNWDPLVTDGLAKNRQIIIFNNTGVASTKGETPDNAQQMANDAVAFITALGYKKVDLLGYSLGGFIAQLIASQHAELVNKIILAGTGPQGGTGYKEFRQFTNEAFAKKGAEVYLHIFANTTESSRAKMLSVLKRLHQRGEQRDADSSMQTIVAQTKAIVNWGNTGDGKVNLLKSIKQPVLIANGNNDRMFPAINSFTLFQEIENAQLSLYPDSSHGAIFQHAELFTDQVNYFLEHGIK